MIKSEKISPKRSLIYSFVVLLSVSFLVISCAKSTASDKSPLNHEKPPEFVDSKACAACHQKEHKEWTGSHHDLAMDEATPETVLGDFNEASINNFGIKTSFFRRGDKFFVNTDGPDGELHDYEIDYVFGVDPLQQYLIGFPDGRFQALDIAWDSRSKKEGGERWFLLHPDEEITSEDPLHWTGLTLNWNSSCASCHSTNLKKNYDPESRTYATTFSDIDVGCQACHGPGSKHVEWANLKKGGDETMGLVAGALKGGVREVELCARCHSRRSLVKSDYVYGKDFMDHYVPELLREPYYYPDGQIKEEVFVYGSFIQSKMYGQGVSCGDCHSPHTAGLKTKGNALCVRCHNAEPPVEFATIKPWNYDNPEHSMHKSGSEGAECVNCHMPATDYMVVDPRRDHSFSIPRPDLSVKLSVPNACNRCHVDKPALWAEKLLDAWFPKSKEMRKSETHFAEIIADGEAGRPEAVSGLIEIAKDETKPAIARATALAILSQYRNGEALDIVEQGLSDGNPIMRYEAIGGLSTILGRASGENGDMLKIVLLAPLLTDPVRAVRTEAARVLTEVPMSLFDQENRSAFDYAFEEFKERQYAALDRGEAHLNLAVIYTNMGQTLKAENSYKRAIHIDRFFIPARFNLANLYNSQGRNKEAIEILNELIEIAPDSGEAYYSLGLLLAEMKRLDDAVEPLKKAAELMPEFARVRYNYALALQSTDKPKEAETELLKAYETDSNDLNIVYALSVFFAQQERWDEALPYTERLVELLPDEPRALEILKQVREELSALEGGL